MCARSFSVVLLTLQGLCLGILPTVAVTISTDTVIGPGSPFNGEHITVVDGVGGQTTVQVVEGGTIRGFAALESSHLILDGGQITFVSGMGDQSTFTMNSGEFACSEFACNFIDFAALLGTGSESQVNLYGGSFGGQLGANNIILGENAIVNVFGKNLELMEFGSLLFLRGQFVDGNEISIVLDPAFRKSQVFLFEIPEPSTVLFVLASILFYGFLVGRNSLSRKHIF